jgi:uncharacterized protein (DUF2141 family)
LQPHVCPWEFSDFAERITLLRYADFSGRGGETLTFLSKHIVRALQLLVWMLACQVASAEELTGILMVEITGLKDATGNVYIAVYDSDSTWLSDETVIDKKVSVSDALDGELVRAELQLPPGEYALSVFYDEDSNGELNTNFIGQSKEPVGQSNNASAKFGSPSYEDAVFVLSAEPIIQRITIKGL